MWTTISNSISLHVRGLLDFFFPRYCTACGCRLAVREDTLCTGCWMGLPRVRHASWDDNDIAQVFWGLMPFERGTAFFHYAHHSPYARILADLKYHNRPEVGHVMGRAMAEEFRRKGFFDGVDLIVPVPLAKKKHRARGYNQSEWIARGIAEATRLPVDATSVVRVVANPSQTRLSPEERLDNVRNIFAVARPEALAGRHILLVDDVMTTGATLKSCAETIAHACPVRVSVLCLAWAGGT